MGQIGGVVRLDQGSEALGLPAVTERGVSDPHGSETRLAGYATPLVGLDPRGAVHYSHNPRHIESTRYGKKAHIWYCQKAMPGAFRRKYPPPS